MFCFVLFFWRLSPFLGGEKQNGKPTHFCFIARKKKRLNKKNPPLNFQESVKTQNSFVSKEESSLTAVGSLLRFIFVRWETWNTHAGLQTVGTAIFQQTRGQNICNIVTALILHPFFVLYSCSQLCLQCFITFIFTDTFRWDLLIVLKCFQAPSYHLTPASLW